MILLFNLESNVILKKVTMYTLEISLFWILIFFRVFLFLLKSIHWNFENDNSRPLLLKYVSILLSDVCTELQHHC